MEYRRLGRTGLKVSRLCLGTMQFGWTADEPTSFAVMDAFSAAGGTFLDTSDIYSIGSPDKYGGISEQIIGRWMQARGNRRELVVATKVRGRMSNSPTGEGLNRVHLMRACDDSLRRLQTDYIDLYQAHWYDADTPIEETLETLNDLVRAGKVRYIGCSNYPAWRLALALGTSERLHVPRYDSLQPHYNLAHRAEFERELEPLCIDQNIGVIPYSPLAGGFLTGKYRRGADVPESARASGIQKRYFNERGWAIIDALDQVSHAHNMTITQTALAWLLSRAFITSPIIGANRPEQLQDSLGAVNITLTNEELKQLTDVSSWQE
jgi:aryl-alcohol dehydrogenase-like predicted oxidoreductase